MVATAISMAAAVEAWWTLETERKQLLSFGYGIGLQSQTYLGQTRESSFGNWIVVSANAPLSASGFFYALPFFIGLFFAFEALAFAQATVGFVLGSSVSFVVLMSYLICSAYARHWALLGNALMLLRWGGIVKEGIATGSSGLFSIVIMSLCLSLGGLWFRRADLIEKGDKI